MFTAGSLKNKLKNLLFIYNFSNIKLEYFILSNFCLVITRDHEIFWKLNRILGRTLQVLFIDIPVF